MACYDRGIFTKYNVKMIGANRDAIHRGEDRQVFKDLMMQDRPESARVVRRRSQRSKKAAKYWTILACRSSFDRHSPSAAPGGGIAYNIEEFEDHRAAWALMRRRSAEVLIEQIGDLAGKNMRWR